MPAAAVIRGMQALSGIIGRKAPVGCLVSQLVKDLRLNLRKAQWKLLDLSMAGVEGISSVAVKCVDIRKNTRWRKRSTGPLLTLRGES